MKNTSELLDWNEQHAIADSFFPTKDLALAEGKKFLVANDKLKYDHDTDKFKIVKRYRGFDSIKEILDWYLPIPENQKHYYYCLTGEWVEFYDIDGKWTDVVFKEKTIDDIKADFLYVRKLFLNQQIYTNSKAVKETYLWENSSDNIKVSLHLTIRNGFKFANCDEIKTYTQSFHSFIEENNHLVKFDKGIYNTDRPMRMVYSTKIGTNRVLFPEDDTVPLGLYFACNTFSEQIITRYDEEPIVPEKGYGKKSKIVDDSPIILEDNELTRLIELIYESIDTGCHSLCDKEVSNRMCYDDWKGLAFAIIRVTNGECKNEFNKIFQLYRHSDEHNALSMYKSMKKFRYGWTLSSLHRWAEENPLYPTVFKDKYKSSYEPVIQRLLDRKKTNPKSLSNKEKDAVEEAVIAKKKKAVVELTSFDDNAVIKTDKYVNFTDFYGQKVTIVKAGLGKGKSYATAKFIGNDVHRSSTPYRGIIVVTPRISYSESRHKTLFKETGIDFTLYRNKKGMLNDPYIIVQVESLHRLTPDFDNFLIILDECEAILDQMTSKDTHCKNHTNNIIMLKSMIQESSKVLCLDAFISNRTLYYFKLLNISYDFIHYVVPNEQRICVNLESDDVKENLKNIVNKCCELLALGEKLFFFFASNTKLKTILKPTLDSMFPTKKICYYADGIKPIIPITEVERWVECDMIVCTTKITVGINFDIPNHFDSLLLYGSNANCGNPRDWFQSLYRVRHPTKKILYYVIDYGFFASSYVKSIASIKNTIDNNTNLKYNEYVKHFGQHKQYHPEYRFLNYFSEFERDISKNACLQICQYYLNECNYIEAIPDLNVTTKPVPIIWLSDKIEFPEIPLLSQKSAEELIELQKKNIPLDIAEKASLKKYFFSKKLEDDTSPDNANMLWNFYDNYNEFRFDNLSYEMGFLNHNFFQVDLIFYNDGELATTKNMTLKLAHISKIVEILKINNTEHLYHEIRYEDLEILGLYFLDNFKDIKTVWKYTDKRTNKAIFKCNQIIVVLNHILEKWSFSKIDKKGNQKQKRAPNGDKINYYIYHLIHNEHIKCYAGYVNGRENNGGAILKLELPYFSISDFIKARVINDTTPKKRLLLKQ